MLEYIRDGLISTNQQNYRISNEITSPTNFSSFFKYLLPISDIENYIAHYFNRNMFMNYINHIRDANQMKPVAMLAGFVSNKDKNIADQFFESLKVSMPFIKLNFSIEFYEHLMSDWFFERFYDYVEETLKSISDLQSFEKVLKLISRKPLEKQEHLINKRRMINIIQESLTKRKYDENFLKLSYNDDRSGIYDALFNIANRVMNGEKFEIEEVTPFVKGKIYDGASFVIDIEENIVLITRSKEDEIIVNDSY